MHPVLFVSFSDFTTWFCHEFLGGTVPAAVSTRFRRSHTRGRFLPVMVLMSELQKVSLEFTLALGMDQLLTRAEPRFLSGTGQQIGSLLRDKNLPRYALNIQTNDAHEKKRRQPTWVSNGRKLGNMKQSFSCCLSTYIIHTLCSIRAAVFIVSPNS